MSSWQWSTNVAYPMSWESRLLKVYCSQTRYTTVPFKPRSLNDLFPRFFFCLKYVLYILRLPIVSVIHFDMNAVARHCDKYENGSQKLDVNWIGMAQNWGLVRPYKLSTRVGTLIVVTIYLQLIQNRYMFRSFTVLQCSHQHCVQPVASDVEVVGYL